MRTVVRRILDRHGRLSLPADQLSDHDNLHRAGLDSMAMVNVMMALEEALDIEFPEESMTRDAFSSIAALCAVLQHLKPTMPVGRAERDTRLGV